MNLDSKWDFNAPQFVDFTNDPENDSDAERYFDVDHEEGMVMSYYDSDDDNVRHMMHKPGGQRLQPANRRSPGGQTLRSGRTTGGKHSTMTKTAKLNIAGNAADAGAPAGRLFVVGMGRLASVKNAPGRVAIDRKTQQERRKMKEVMAAKSMPETRRASDGSPNAKKACRVPVTAKKQPSTPLKPPAPPRQPVTALRVPVKPVGRAGSASHASLVSRVGAMSRASSVGRALKVNPVSNIVAAAMAAQQTQRLRSASAAPKSVVAVTSASSSNRRRSRSTAAVFIGKLSKKCAAAVHEIQPRASIDKLRGRAVSAVLNSSALIDPGNAPVLVDSGLRRGRSASASGARRVKPDQEDGKVVGMEKGTVPEASRTARDRSVLRRRSASQNDMTLIASDQDLENAEEEMAGNDGGQDRVVKPGVGRGRTARGGRLTLPATPQILKRNIKSSYAPAHKTREQLEWDRIEDCRLELQLARQASKDSLQRALAPAVEFQRHVRPTTRAVGFNFAVDQRIKPAAPVGGRGKAGDVGDFAAGLRKHEPLKAQPRITRPEPFGVTNTSSVVERKRKREESRPPLPASGGYKFQTFGEKVYQFANKTPQRFRAKRGVSPLRERNDVRRPTVPRTPNLTTKQRARPGAPAGPSRAELEDQEVEEMKRHQFRALPLNERVLHATGPLGVKPVPARPVTICQPFDLAPDKRALPLAEQLTVVDDPVGEVFHAQPFPRAIFEAPQKLKSVGEPKLATLAQSPAFALKARRAAAAAAKQDESSAGDETLTGGVIYARPVPDFSEPFQPQPSRRAPIESKPFSFDGKTQEMREEREARLARILEEERIAREFVAQPMPDHQAVVLPERHVRSLTEVVPFKLAADARGAERAEKWKQKLEEQLRAERKACVFKARPATSVLQAAFEPTKLQRSVIVDTAPFDFHTDRRAEAWRERDDWLRDKEATDAAEREARESERRAEEEREVQRARGAAVHRANPVRQYKAVVILPSTEPMTYPQSPNFSERLKQRGRSATVAAAPTILSAAAAATKVASAAAVDIAAATDAASVEAAN